MAYNNEKFTTRELGEVKKSEKSYVRIAHVTDNEKNEEFVDIRQGFMRDNEKILTGKGIRIEISEVPTLVKVLEDFINS